MYIGHARLCVCLSLAAFSYYCTEPDVTWGNGRRCPLVVHYWADLQSVHRFRCYDNIARTRNVRECLYSVLAVCLVKDSSHNDVSAYDNLLFTNKWQRNKY